MASSAEAFLERAKERLERAENDLAQAIRAQAPSDTVTGLRTEVQNRKRIVTEWQAEVDAGK